MRGGGWWGFGSFRNLKVGNNPKYAGAAFGDFINNGRRFRMGEIGDRVSGNFTGLPYARVANEAFCFIILEF